MLANARAREVHRAYISQGRQASFVNHLHYLSTPLRFNGLCKVLAMLGLLHLSPKLTGLAVL
jgi:hypothetical protein